MCVYLYIIIIHENNMFKRYQLVPRVTAAIKNRHLFIGTTEYNLKPYYTTGEYRYQYSIILSSILTESLGRLLIKKKKNNNIYNGPVDNRSVRRRRPTAT